MPNPIRSCASLRSCRGLSVTELLIVIGIMVLLVGFVVPVLAESRRTSRIMQCQNNLKQFLNALELYDQEHDNPDTTLDLPGRLTYLHRDRYTPDQNAFLCPLDPTRGHDGGKPASVADQFPETDEGPGRGNPSMPMDTPWSSYFYECSEAPCGWWDGWIEDSWNFPPLGPGDIEKGDPYSDEDIVDTDWNGTVTWQETKIYQQKYGDRYLHDTGGWEGGYPDTWFPIIRCFWHQKEDKETTHQEVSNLSMSGNLFISSPLWELIAVSNLDPDFDKKSAHDMYNEP